MTDINNTVLVGRLTKDIEIKYTNSGAAIGNLSIAVNRSRKQDDQRVDEASFFDVKIYGKTAESLRPYLTKGNGRAVGGSESARIRPERKAGERTGRESARPLLRRAGVRHLQDCAERPGLYEPERAFTGEHNRERISEHRRKERIAQKTIDVKQENQSEPELF